MIVLFGATGYAGSLTARAMVARGLSPVLAGRDPARLAALAEQLGGLRIAQADVADRTSVFELVSRGDVLVSTVGPFRRLGWPAVRAAVRAGATYLDAAGEPPFIRSVQAWFGPQAQRAGVALLPAFGHAFVPGVLAGALALGVAGPTARRVDIGYFLTGVGARAFSRATVHSALGLFLESGYAWRDGVLCVEPAAARRRTFVIGRHPRPAVTTGGAEQFALPRLAPSLRTVDVYVGWFGPASSSVRAAASIASATARVPGARRALSASVDLATRGLPAVPSGAGVERVRTHVVAEVFDGDGVLLARRRLQAAGPYATTARLLAWGAERAATHGVTGTGALDAVAAFGLDALVAAAAEIGITPTGADRPG